MITCKEDLINTYIENDHGELFDAWVDAVAKFKVRVPQTGGIDFFRGKQVKFCVISSLINKKGQTEWVEDSDWTIRNNYKQLTLSDLKRTKQSTAVETLERMGYEWQGGELWKPPLGKPKFEYEYVKVTDSIFDLRDEFEHGGLYFAANGDIDNMRVIETELHLVQLLKSQMEFTNRGYVYRRTEKQVDWKEEVRALLVKPSVDGKFSIDKHCITVNCTFSEDEFLELCRVALRARGEL